MNAEYLCPVLTAFTDDGHFDSDGCNGRADAPRNGGKEKFL